MKSASSYLQLVFINQWITSLLTLSIGGSISLLTLRHFVNMTAQRIRVPLLIFGENHTEFINGHEFRNPTVFIYCLPRFIARESWIRSKTSGVPKASLRKCLFKFWCVCYILTCGVNLNTHKQQQPSPVGGEKLNMNRNWHITWN